MQEIDFWLPDWKNAKKVFDFYSQESNCFDAWGRLKICPRYVVAMGNDMISAYYAAYIVKLVCNQYHTVPKILCVGGSGRLSKYINRLEDGTVLSNGRMLWWVLCQFGNFNCTILENGDNIVNSLKEIADYLAYMKEQYATLLFCLPKRLSKRIARANAFLPVRFMGTKMLNAYYYVPGERMNEMCSLYNGKAVAGGIPLLSEAADLFNCMSNYDTMYMAENEKCASKDLLKAGEELIHRYPLSVSHCLLTAPVQFYQVHFDLIKYQKEIREDLHRKIIEWQCYV